MPSENLLRVADVARRLGLCQRTVWTLVRHGGLPSIKLGRSVRFDPAAIDAWLLSQPSAAKPLPEKVA